MSDCMSCVLIGEAVVCKCSGNCVNIARRIYSVSVPLIQTSVAVCFGVVALEIWYIQPP